MKKIKTLFFVFCFILTFASCVGTPIIFDDSIPLQESVQIYIYPGVEITSYNDKPVPTQRAPLTEIGFKSTWRNVILPAGDIEFGVSVNYLGKKNNLYVTRDVLFKHKFENGPYTILFIHDGGVDDNTWGVNIYQGMPPAFGKPKKANLIAFSQFYI